MPVLSRPLLLGLLSLALWGAGAESSRLLEDIRYLASDQLKGRGNGEPELEEAAQYLARRFEELHWLPGGDNGSYFQSFEVSLGHTLGPENSLQIRVGGERFQLQVGKDYFPISTGPHRRLEAPLVFAGFGISAPELNYDDYQGVDVRGKVVVVFQHEPQEQSESSPFGGKSLTPYATILHKTLNAKHRGASAVLLIPDGFNHREAWQPRWSAASVEDMGIPAFELTQEWGERLIQLSGRQLAEINRWIHGQLTPYSFLAEHLTVSFHLDVEETRRSLKNVVAWLPGEGEEVILVGAHYDHLGLGGKGSLAPDRLGEIHNGADDNASGTAGLLELARRLRGAARRRNLVLAAFAGEELGLLGSQHYVQHPLFPLQKTITMINLDMIGRSQGEVMIGGVGTARQFEPLLSGIPTPLRLNFAQTPRGASDHLSFVHKKIPVLFFFSGLHADYHRPSDDWEKIELGHTLQILDLVEQFIRRLDGLASAPEYVELGTEPLVLTGLGSSERGYGPLFGSIPDMAWEGEGVRFAGIRPETPASRAGLQEGDVLVEFDGKRIDNLYDFTYALRSRQAGDEVKVVVLRQGRTLTFYVRLDVRNR